MSDQDGSLAWSISRDPKLSPAWEWQRTESIFSCPLYLTREMLWNSWRKGFLYLTYFSPLSIYTWKGGDKNLTCLYRKLLGNGLSKKLQSYQMLKIKNASYRRVNQRYAKLNTNLSLNRVSQLPPKYNLCSWMGMKSCISRAVGAFVCFLKCLVEQQCRAVKIGLFLCALWAWLLTEKARGLCESVLVHFCTRLLCVWSPTLCKWCLWPHEPLFLPQTSFCSGTVTAATVSVWWPPAPTC